MKGYFLNIGLNVGTVSTMGYEIGETINPLHVEIMMDGSFKTFTVIDNDNVDEPTAVVELYRPMSAEGISVLMSLFGQKAIPQVVNGIGQMYGSDEWGDFDPKYFVMPDGKRMNEA